MVSAERIAFVMRYGHQGWRDIAAMDAKTFSRIFMALKALVILENQASERTSRNKL